VQLGRRFRSLKLWFVIRHYGVEGLQYHVRKHIRMARELAKWIQQDDDFELVTKPPLNVICFRLKASNAWNMKLMNGVNESGKAFFTHTKLNGKVVLRLVVGQTHTEEKQVKNVWKLIQNEKKSLI
jgi:aromatic-L-amino-acid/L-tryptophan decarboxylase